MARGDHHTRARRKTHHVVADGRGGRGAVAKPHVNVVGRQHLGNRGSEAVRTETGVVADDHSAPGGARRAQVAGQSLCAHTDVSEREVVADDRSPAVRAESDSHHFQLPPHAAGRPL